MRLLQGLNNWTKTDEAGMKVWFEQYWKWKQIVAPEYDRMIPILRIAAMRFNDSSYEVVADAVERHIGTSPQPNFSMPVD